MSQPLPSPPGEHRADPWRNEKPPVVGEDLSELPPVKDIIGVDLMGEIEPPAGDVDLMGEIESSSGSPEEVLGDTVRLTELVDDALAAEDREAAEMMEVQEALTAEDREVAPVMEQVREALTPKKTSATRPPRRGRTKKGKQ